MSQSPAGPQRTVHLSAKKIKRLESKRKKAEAFLDLVKSKAVEKQPPPIPVAAARFKSVANASAFTTVTDTASVNFIEEKPSSSEVKGTSHNKMASASTTSGQVSTKSVADSSLDEDAIMEMKRLIRERKKQAMQKIKVFLTREDMVPFRRVDDQPVTEEEIPPLFAMDLQHLLLYGMQGNLASYKPRWCKLLRVNKLSSVVLILLNGISYSDFEDNKDSFQYIKENFPNCVEMISPHQYGKTLEEELHCVPLSVSQLKKKNFKVPESVKKQVAEKIAPPPPPKDPESPADTKCPEKAKNVDAFSRTCLLLSPFQMMIEGYPLPVSTKDDKYKGYVFTKDQYKKVSSDSPLFALDCEMCYTTAQKNECTRVSIIAENGEVLLDSLVKPWNRILNYLTRYSGITKQMLDPVTTRLKDVQEKIREILPADAILCGQSLNGDLNSLKIFHPYVIDTSVIYNMSGDRRAKTGLKKLTQFFLNRSIQTGSDGHCSTEDATATLELIKLKLTKGIEFGDATLTGVYFPDVKTYFIGGKNGTAENVEQELRTRTPVSGPGIGNAGTELSTTNGRTTGGSDKKIVPAIPASSFKKGDSSDESAESECGPSAAKRTKIDTVSKSDGGEENSGNTQDPKGGQVTLLKDVKSTSAFLEEQQKFMFEQDSSVHVSHSLFRLIYEAGRSACFIDKSSTVERFAGEPIDRVTAVNDSEACQAAKVLVQSKEFVWVQFHEYETLVTGEEDVGLEEKQTLFQKMDKRVEKIVKKTKPNSLVIVSMLGLGGHEAAQSNMATLLMTT